MRTPLFFRTCRHPVTLAIAADYSSFCEMCMRWRYVCTEPTRFTPRLRDLPYDADPANGSPLATLLHGWDGQ